MGARGVQVSTAGDVLGEVVEDVAPLIETAAALLPGLPGALLPHVIEFLAGLVHNDKARAERAATLATTLATWERPR